MSMNDSFATIWETLQQCNRVAITLHYTPDGDSLGACTAMKHILEQEGCRVTLVSGDTLGGDLAQLPAAADVDFAYDFSDLHLAEYDAIVALDSGNIPLLSAKQKDAFVLPEDVMVVNIDHHESNPFYGTYNYIDASQSSTCDILVACFQQLELPISHAIAERLFLGIVTDTGLFKWGCDLAASLSHAGTLMHLYPQDIQQHVIHPLFLQTPLQRKRFQQIVLRNLQTHEATNTVYSVITQQEWEACGLNESEARGAVHEIADIAEYDIAFTLLEVSDGIKGSLRCQSKTYDVSQIAEQLNGGGHVAAAGFRLQSMQMETAIQQVLDAIEAVIQH